MKDGRQVLMSIVVLEKLKALKVAEKQSYSDVVEKLIEFVVERIGKEEEAKYVLWLGGGGK